MLVVALWLLLFSRFLRRRPLSRSCGRPFVSAALPALRARKPDWVLEELIRLKAHLPYDGCRKIAALFNRLHGARHGMTVSKTHVARMLRLHRHRIASLRADWKHRVPQPVPANHVWGLDLTTKTDLAGLGHPVLGIVDHGTRLAVALEALQTKASVANLRALLSAIERHGRPRSIRTDNERVFTGRLFGFALAFLGIRHQRTELHCPWQNGRIERFFGTLKERLNAWAVEDFEQLRLALGDFRDWYNLVRPHEHLGVATPAEAWRRIDPMATAPGYVSEFTAWDGLLRGYYLRR